MATRATAAVSGVSVRTIQRIEKGDRASFETLKALAAAFKVDVKDLLDPPHVQPVSQASNITFLVRITTGTDLFKIVGGTGAYSFEQGELQGEEQVSVVSDFVQDLRDRGEIWSDIEPAERVRVTHEFTSRIGEVEHLGLWVFAMRQKRTFTAGDTSVPLDLAIVYITNVKNSEIVSLELRGGALPTKTP